MQNKQIEHERLIKQGSDKQAKMYEDNMKERREERKQMEIDHKRQLDEIKVGNNTLELQYHMLLFTLATCKTQTNMSIFVVQQALN